ncbi:ankyrin [Lophiostoma macrostomum CBS 122681]|uniref:Ankyrin n=1 Tax=Lophiostoma macrostomum CBS 122681 TaxID=1314788 RepID=A0A6A6TCQ0_9PLEO|nr:ankyrin [Lophiostoma macrostomum CBS 122681]
MELLALPPEIFGLIVHEFVENVGVVQAMQYGQVCSTFSRAIKYEVFAKQPLSAFEDKQSQKEQTRKALLLCSNIHLYLYYRTKSLLDSNSLLPDQINKVVNFLYENQEEPRRKDRDFILGKVCTTAAPRAYHVLINGDHYPYYESSDAENLIAAASAYGDTKMLLKVLEEFPETFEKESFGFGNPVTHAVERGDMSYFKLILDHLWKDLGRNSRGYLSPPEELLSEPIITAIRQGNTHMTRLLMTQYQKSYKSIPKCRYSHWLSTSVANDNVEVARLILALKVKSEPRVALDTFRTACRKDNEEMIRALVGTGRLSANKAFKNECPLTLAIHYGKIEVIKAVLEAGAHPDGPHPGVRKFPSKEWVTPLFKAIAQGDIDAVNLLLQCGADAEKRSEYKIVCSRGIHPRLSPLIYALKLGSRNIYDVLREAKMKKNGHDVETYEEARANLIPAQNK